MTKDLDFFLGWLFWFRENQKKEKERDQIYWYRGYEVGFLTYLILLLFSSKVWKTIATTAFVMIIRFIRRDFRDSTRTWRWRTRNKVQICPFSSHEIIENRPSIFGSWNNLVLFISISGLNLLVLIFTTPFLQKYAAKNPIFHWHHIVLQQKKNTLNLWTNMIHVEIGYFFFFKVCIQSYS